jgi:hypothetical protein
MEFQIETHHLFIDFKTAYEKVKRNQLYKAMLELGIPPKIVRLIQATMEGTTAKVKIQNELSESFHIRNGLRQGDALACILFNIVLENIIREANINQRGNISTNRCRYQLIQMILTSLVDTRNLSKRPQQ